MPRGRWQRTNQSLRKSLFEELESSSDSSVEGTTSNVLRNLRNTRHVQEKITNTLKKTIQDIVRNAETKDQSEEESSTISSSRSAPTDSTETILPKIDVESTLVRSSKEMEEMQSNTNRVETKDESKLEFEKSPIISYGPRNVGSKRMKVKSFKAKDKDKAKEGHQSDAYNVENINENEEQNITVHQLNSEQDFEAENILEGTNKNTTKKRSRHSAKHDTDNSSESAAREIRKRTAHIVYKYDETDSFESALRKKAFLKKSRHKGFFDTAKELDSDINESDVEEMRGASSAKSLEAFRKKSTASVESLPGLFARPSVADTEEDTSNSLKVNVGDDGSISTPEETSPQDFMSHRSSDGGVSAQEDTDTGTDVLERVLSPITEGPEADRDRCSPLPDLNVEAEPRRDNDDDPPGAYERLERLLKWYRERVHENPDITFWDFDDENEEHEEHENTVHQPVSAINESDVEDVRGASPAKSFESLRRKSTASVKSLPGLIARPSVADTEGDTSNSLEVNVGDIGSISTPEETSPQDSACWKSPVADVTAQKGTGTVAEFEKGLTRDESRMNIDISQGDGSPAEECPTQPFRDSYIAEKQKGAAVSKDTKAFLAEVRESSTGPVTSGKHLKRTACVDKSVQTSNDNPTPAKRKKYQDVSVQTSQDLLGVNVHIYI